MHPCTDRRLAKLVEIADIFGIDRTEFERGIPGGYEGIVYQATYEAQRRDGAHTDNESHWTGRYAASVWMFISGLTGFRQAFWLQPSARILAPASRLDCQCLV